MPRHPIPPAGSDKNPATSGRFGAAAARLWLLLALATLTAGCGTTAPRRSPLVTIAIVTTGGAAPTAGQAAHIHQAILPMLTRAGFGVAETRDVADFILAVRFAPDSSGVGGHVAIMGIEPARSFREATEAGETAEAKEWRQRQREIERWIAGQSRNYETNN